MYWIGGCNFAQVEGRAVTTRPARLCICTATGGQDGAWSCLVVIQQDAWFWARMQNVEVVANPILHLKGLDSQGDLDLYLSQESLWSRPIFPSFFVLFGVSFSQMPGVQTTISVDGLEDAIQEHLLWHGTSKASAEAIATWNVKFSLEFGAHFFFPPRWDRTFEFQRTPGACKWNHTIATIGRFSEFLKRSFLSLFQYLANQ